MATKPPEMDPDFARWYAEAFMDTGPTREARWKAVTEVASSADHLAVEVLVRLALVTGSPPAGHKNEALEKAHAAILAIINKGPALEPTRTARELQLLAAAALVRLFASKPDAALAVSTASFLGQRTAELPMALPTLAATALQNLSSRQHTRIDPKTLGIKAPEIDFVVSEAAAQQNSAAQWTIEIEGLRDAIDAALVDLTASLVDVVETQTKRIALADEELQMLWWLTAGRSKDANAAFIEISPASKPLILGRELGNLTTVSPGPVSAGAMLARAGVGGADVKLQDAVNDLDVAWAAAASKQTTISPATTPIHFAIEKRVELGSKDAWQAAWAATTGLSADLAVSPVALAELFYREHLFLYTNA